jgi:hypothetical protein
MYTTLPLFWVVWYPAGLSSPGSDTPQGFDLWGLEPCGIKWKSFKSLPITWKGHFFNVSAYINYTTQGIHDPCIYRPPSLTFFPVLRGIRPCRTTFNEYLRKFETEIENILGYESGAHIQQGWFMKKNQRPKISCYLTFNWYSSVDTTDIFMVGLPLCSIETFVTLALTSADTSIACTLPPLLSPGRTPSPSRNLSSQQVNPVYLCTR